MNIDNPNNNKYYTKYDEEFEFEPWAIYKELGVNDKGESSSICIARAYEEGDAIDIVNGLNTITMI